MHVSDRRVPPGQSVTARFPRLDLGVVPRFDERTWRLHVEGLVGNPLSLGYGEVLKLLGVSETSDFHCVTGWSRLDNRWEGIRFRTIVDISRPEPEARFVTLESGDGYFTSLPLSDLLRDDVLLAHSLEGKPLTPEHGGPLRLVVPKKYAYKSAKWVERIKFTAEKELGYWEQRGYSDSADPGTEDRYSR